jgi:catechol 2,3-dioxygenase-like lactoylglutathione lyase family enzyme
MTTSAADELEAKRQRLQSRIPSGIEDASTKGVNHIAVFAKDLEATAEFYSEIMGMPVIGVTANRDVTDSTHMNVDIGSGTSLAFFDFPNVPRLRRRAPEGVGNVMHIALPISQERFEQVKVRLDKNRVKYQVIGGSLYLKDPNGLGLELMPARRS